jgi:hypothetical protein
MSYLIKYNVQPKPIADPEFAIDSVFGLRGIGLSIRNKSNDAIEVVWDQSVYINEEGNASRLTKSNVDFVEKDRPQPNTMIPPGAKLSVTVFPVDRIAWNDGKWEQTPLFPEMASFFGTEYAVERAATSAAAPVSEPVESLRAKTLVGKEVRLFLRLLVNDQKRSVTIPFKIVDVMQ